MAVAFEVETAVTVVGSLAEYVRPALPERPLSFPERDDDLKMALRRARQAVRPSSEEKTLLGEFGAWAHACAQTLCDAEQRCLALLLAARSLETVGKGDPTATAMRAQLAEFLLVEWGTTLGATAPTYWNAKKVAHEAASGLRAPAPAAIEDARLPESSREEW